MRKKQALLAASVAGLVAAAGLASLGQCAQEDEIVEKVPCYGINKCKGSGDCGGKGHACAGKNECKGGGYIKLEKETCLRIQGSRLTEEPAAS